MPNCSVAVCNSYNQVTTDKNISYHRFPKDKKLRDIWIKKCKRKDKVNPNNGRICSLHFLPEDYKRDLMAELLNIPSKSILKSTAIPTQNLNPSDIQKNLIITSYNYMKKFLKPGSIPSRNLPKSSTHISPNKDRKNVRQQRAAVQMQKREESILKEKAEFLRQEQLKCEELRRKELEEIKLKRTKGEEEREQLKQEEQQQMQLKEQELLQHKEEETLIRSKIEEESLREMIANNREGEYPEVVTMDLEFYTGDNRSVSEAMDFSTEEILPDIKPDISTLGILETSVDESLQEDNKNFVKALTIDSGKCASVSSIANPEESTVKPCEDIKPIVISVVGSINETTKHIHSTTTDSTMTSDDAIPVNLPVPVSETQEDSGPSSTPLPSAYIFEKVNDLVTNSNMTTNESCKILLESARTSVVCTETIDVSPVVEDSNKHLHVSVSSKNTPTSVTSLLNTAVPIVKPPFQPKLDIDILREMKQANDAFHQKANKVMAKQIRLMEKQTENQNIIVQLLKQQANGQKFSYL